MRTLISLAALGVLAVSSQAQVSKLYLTSYDSTASFIVQGGNVVGTFSRANSNENALAVTNDIKTFQRVSGSGSSYDLDGNFTGPLMSVNPGFVDCYDGATDGSRTWTVAHNDFDTNFAVIQGGADWSGAAVAFSPMDRSSGITFDSTNGTLWIARNAGGSDGIDQYDTAGNWISGFSYSFINGGYGLAYDAADDTLWLPGGFGNDGFLYQFSKTGTLLNTVSVAGLVGQNIMGAEFQAVPEPATMAVLGLGLLAMRRRRR
jgi:hypothetical protein